MGVAGWVRNEPDGSVVIVAEGSKRKVQKLAEWAKEGPPGAMVRKMSLKKTKKEGFEGFEIRKSG